MSNTAQATSFFHSSYPASVRWWLVLGLVMIFFQVFIGGITRLTGSGLSITKWEIVLGTLPPMNAAAWEEAFELYKATPQYQKINKGMDMGTNIFEVGSFKFIYFWEYFHRLWARSMGFVFLLPFIFFLRKQWIDRHLRNRLITVCILAAIVASFGWIMVASGLENRPWVNAYKLTAHLSLALICFGYLLWTTLEAWNFKPFQLQASTRAMKKGLWVLMVLLVVQILLGGVMSGMKAALVYPTFPDMQGEAIPTVLKESGNWSWFNMEHYDQSNFAPAIIQFLHRGTAYALVILGLWWCVSFIKKGSGSYERTTGTLLAIMLISQVLLGIFTLLYSIGIVPVGLGVAHQSGAILLLSLCLFHLFGFRQISKC